MFRMQDMSLSYPPAETVFLEMEKKKHKKPALNLFLSLILTKQENPLCGVGTSEVQTGVTGGVASRHMSWLLLYRCWALSLRPACPLDCKHQKGRCSLGSLVHPALNTLLGT